jgi:hypothetical protein
MKYLSIASSSTSLFLMGAAISAVLYSALFFFNDWITEALKYDLGVSWIYLPAGLRLLLILIFGLAGAIGIAAASAALKTPCMREPRGSNTEDDMLEGQFEKWYAQIKDERFWSWLEETDNDTHFKSKENLLFWSERPRRSD